MSGKSKVLAYRLDDETENKLAESVNNLNFDRFSELMDDVEANYKTVNAIKRMVRELDKFQQLEWGKKLIKVPQATHIVIGAYLVDRNRLFEKQPEFILELVKQYAQHDDWNVRQSSVDLLKRMVSETDDHMIGVIDEFIHSDNPYFRRLALLTSKAIAKSASYDDELKEKLLYTIEDTLLEEDPYVETVSAETFNEGYMKYCTEMTLNWIEEKLEEEDNMLIKTSVLNILSSRYVHDYIDRVLTIIDGMLPEDDEEVKKARSNALHTLSEIKHDRVAQFLEDRLHIQNAVDHWAELEADGSLNSFMI